MVRLEPPARIPAVLPESAAPEVGGESLQKRSPHDGRLLWELASAGAEGVASAVAAAVAAQPGWAATSAPARGEVLHRLADLLDIHVAEVADVVARETGKSPAEARGEVGGAATLGRFFAGEGVRLFGRTTPSHVATKTVLTLREPVGVAALIAAANTPIANIAWKVFPALVCGNAAVLKAAETAPGVAWAVAELAREAGVPAGVLGVVNGGPDVGRALVADPRVDLVSFTGSSAVGREIARTCADRLARVSLELGGKNALVVCDDADLELAVGWALRSAFSNAGQRCAAGSRIIVTDGVREEFLGALVAGAEALRVGPDDGDDLGPVITPQARDRILAAVATAVADGHRLRCGGGRLEGPAHAAGNYVAPTVLEMRDHDHAIGEEELFGPVAEVYPAADYAEALALANRSPYGLTAAIHTRDYGRAMHFVRNVSTGVAVVNGGTYGSEPHMPFGGRRLSGNGTREPGPEALDVYTSLKAVYLWADPGPA